MSTKTLGPVFSILALGAIAIAGCTSPSTPPETSPPATSGSADDHFGHDHAGHESDGQSDMEKMTAELAKLSPEDRASAEKQHYCPVSDKMLGTMGAPQKVDVNGRLVWICCSGCKDELLKNPEEHLAKLKSE